MRIGILETGFPPKDLQARHGLYSDMFKRLLGGRGWEFPVWRVALGELPERPEEADGWLITGSKYGVYDDLDWIRAAEGFTRACLAAKVPLVGICFGHQLMAQAAGGRVVKSDRGWGIGAHDYQDVERGGSFRVIASHQDQVEEAPADTRLIARSEFCPIAGLEWTDAPAISWQPHPEFGPEFSRALIESRRGEVYAPEVADPALASLDKPLDSGALAERIARFFEKHARAEAV